MATLPGIASCYQPQQPSVKAGAAVTYSELQPAMNLRSHIYCYWELRTRQVLTDSFYYRVVADGCIDVFFDISNEEAPYIMGLSSRYTSFETGNEFHYIGIRFLPVALPFICGFDAALVTNRCELLSDVLPGIAKELKPLLAGKKNIRTYKVVLDQYWSTLIENCPSTIDMRLMDALKKIIDTNGNVQLGKDLYCGLSDRQLRRLFHQYIGESPKLFSKIIRFQNLLRAKPSVASLKRHKLFFDAGYYDQAHFIKEFKLFYGDTPTIALDE